MKWIGDLGLIKNNILLVTIYVLISEKTVTYDLTNDL